MDAQNNFTNLNHSHLPCDPGIRIEILGMIKKWISESDQAICVVHGIAGFGGSAIEQSAGILDLLGTGGWQLAASFLFNRQEQEGCSPRCIIETIASQVTVSFPGMEEPVRTLMQQKDTLDARFEHKSRKAVIEPLLPLPAD